MSVVAVAGAVLIGVAFFWVLMALMTWFLRDYNQSILRSFDTARVGLGKRLWRADARPVFERQLRVVTAISRALRRAWPVPVIFLVVGVALEILASR